MQQQVSRIIAQSTFTHHTVLIGIPDSSVILLCLVSFCLTSVLKYKPMQQHSDTVDVLCTVSSHEKVCQLISTLYFFVKEDVYCSCVRVGSHPLLWFLMQHISETLFCEMKMLAIVLTM